MALPPSAFAVSFRKHVGPRLDSMIDVLGHFVGLGLYSFDEAFHDIAHYARLKGARHLTPDHYDALDDWICSELMEAAAETDDACGG